MFTVEDGAVDLTLKAGGIQTAMWFKINGHSFGYMIRSKKELISFFGETVGSSPLCEGLIENFPYELKSITEFVQQLYGIVFSRINKL